jgi:acyl carrier protein
VSLIERVLIIIEGQLGVKHTQITVDTRFIDDLGADSLSGLELIMALEEEFNITITDVEAERVRKVGDIIELLKSKGVTE